MQAKEIVEDVELLTGEFSNSDLDDCLSVCSDVSIDEIELTSKDDPIFMDENLELWGQKPLHNFVSKYLNSRLTSFKLGTTIGEFRQNLSKMKADEETSLFKSKCERLRRFERVAKLREIEPIFNTKGILIVKDLHNIVFEYGPCKYGLRCFNNDCIFSHPPKPPQPPRQQWRPQNSRGRNTQFFGRPQADKPVDKQSQGRDPQFLGRPQTNGNPQFLGRPQIDKQVDKQVDNQQPSVRNPQFLGRPQNSRGRNTQFFGRPQADKPVDKQSQGRDPQFLGRPQTNGNPQFLGRPQIDKQVDKQVDNQQPSVRNPQFLGRPQVDRQPQGRNPQFLARPQVDKQQQPQGRNPQFLARPQVDRQPQGRNPQFLARPQVDRQPQGRNPQFLGRQEAPAPNQQVRSTHQDWQVAGRRPQFIPPPNINSNFVIKCETNAPSGKNRVRQDARPRF